MTPRNPRALDADCWGVLDLVVFFSSRDFRFNSWLVRGVEQCNDNDPKIGEKVFSQNR